MDAQTLQYVSPGYEITETLCLQGESGLFRARNPAGRYVLLRSIHPSAINPATSASLRQEYQLMQSLASRGIADVAKPLALIDEAGYLAMVMHDVPGESLETVLRRQRLALAACLSIACRLASILAGIHAAHLIHRDIRPSRFLATPDGTICLVDFSLATAEVPSVVSSASPGGDFACLSPEQTGRMNRSVDYRTDFYSSGVMLYRMLSGEMPFQASDPVEWVHCHVARVPRPLREVAPQIPTLVSDIVMKLIAKMPEDRYQSAHGLQHDLARCEEQWKATGQIAAFSLGMRDMPERFRVSQMVYGREAETAKLVSAFSRMAGSGKACLALVTGPPGIGKSSLVRELDQPVARARGYFICGAFDQYQRNIPYAPLADALRDLVQKILTESEDSVSSWRKQLQTALGSEGKVVIDLIPQLELIIGPQPAVPQLPPLETQHRFKRVFSQLLDVCAAEAHPLALFLDDVQRADGATLGLLEHLLTRPGANYLMAVATYRDNEVSSAHPLMAAIGAMQDKVAMHEIHLDPLPDEAVARLLADTLHRDTAEVSSLAGILQRKTHRNPFFVNRFLSALHRDGLIEFDPQLPGWRWDNDRIEGAEVTANVVDWMAGQINRLPISLQVMLTWAACLGHQFSLDPLAQLAQRPVAEVAAEIEPAVAQGFLLTVRQPDGSLDYCWSHDKVQQAAYSLLPENERPHVHLTIGRLLLANMPEDHLSERIFEIVNDLNQATTLISDPAERRRLAELNLMAAHRAKRAAAFSAARGYAATGVAQLPPGAWRDDYALALALRRDLIEANYLCRRPAEADALLEEVLRYVDPGADQADLLRLRLSFLYNRSDQPHAVQAALDALRQLGVALPADAEGWAAELRPALKRVDKMLRWVRIEDLADGPVMTDPAWIAITELLEDTMRYAWGVEPHLHDLLAVMLVEISLAHGHTASSATGYCGYGVVLHRMRQDLERGYRFGRLARRLAEKFGRPDIAAKTDFHVATFLGCWYEPLQQIVAMRLKGFDIALEHGDLTWASYHLMHVPLYQLASGTPLDSIADGLAQALEFSMQSANDRALRSFQSMDRLVTDLRRPPGGPPVAGISSPAALDEVLERLRGHADASTRIDYCSELKRFVLFGAFENAMRLANSPGTRIMDNRLTYLGVEWGFYRALAAAAVYDTQDESTRQSTLALLQAEQKKLTEDAHRCPPNFAPFLQLLAAELARISGEAKLAASRYESAIATAEQYGANHLRGLCAERAMRACEATGATAQAASYWRTARLAYAAWGADAKVEQLDALAYGRLAPGLAGEFEGLGPERLDFLSVVKASQAISGEIVLERLLQTLMRVVIENAGAQKADLILLSPAKPYLAAEARVLGQNTEVQLLQEAEVPESRVPASIVNYVNRSREPVLLSDAAQFNHFSTDPYWQRQQPKSVLCLPILHQANLVGLLYLENNLVTHAFTRGRLAVLQLLASQAAVSLENARLFAALQKENSERKQAEARIRRLVDGNLIGVVFGRFNGEITYANEAFLNMVGYTSDDVARGLHWRDITPPEYGPFTQGVADQLRRFGTVKPYEKEYLRKDGTRVPVLVGAAQFDEEQGAAFVLDLSERKQAESERAARKAAEAASESKSVFLADMSHELRSPLNTMLGFGRLIARRSLPHDVKEDLDIMLRSGEHLRTLINDVLDLAKIEAGRTVLSETDFDLVALANELEGMFSYEANDKSLTLHFEVNGVARFVRTDLVKLRQVLINLLNNALKFTRQGSITLCVTSFAMPAGPRLKFEVADTGVGIAEEELGKLFNPFTQSKAGQQMEGGTGLGLVISRSLVRLMGGDIAIESQPGRGTSISFDIPLQLVEPNAAARAAAQRKRRVVALAPGQPHYRILVVDDRPDARRLLSRLLISVGFEVQEAANGEEAIANWQAWHPHLIWMDIRMPVMDGREAARRIKAGAGGEAATIIALTASGSNEDPAGIIAAGCEDILHKPFQEDDLFALMHKYLGVQYAYEDEAPVFDACTSLDVAALPEPLRVSLQQALVRLDTVAVAKAIAEVQDAALARRLEALASQFQYGQILSLLEGTDEDLEGQT